ncbi:SAM-dependent methyltransferase [Campylobacter sp. MIT 12-5580]|uniref:class I SAM-dependent methyltransferase n=1 Tax=Campylobacter sp. MIT 12-5580 TaxID=2040651 RepID=UPI0010F77F07|nr:class I SAM-dependent methyltransferase [Campylobacter sp. MIT 12-5580]TKX30196.1 SAM-dependent methyltransferase [Campylobacter sp. MIT 12-5580]
MKKFISNAEISTGLGSPDEIWEQIYTHKEWGKYPSEAIIRFIARNFYNAKDRNSVKVLELGLGTGANLWFCAREGFRVSGIEWSKSGIERFEKRMQEEHLSGQIDTLLQGDYAQKLDELEDESFDAFMDSYSLAYNDFEKTKNIIEKAVKKLKKGGKFLSITPSANNFGFKEDKSLGHHCCRPVEGSDAFTGVIRFCDEEDIKKLYEGKDYEVQSISKLTHSSKGVVENDLFIITGVKHG